MNRTSESTDGDSNMASEGDEEDVTIIYPPTKQERKSTARKTAADIVLFQEFFRELNECRKVHSIPYERLDELLAAFIMSGKTRDGQEYEIHTVKGMFASVDRYLLKHKYGHYLYFGKNRDSFPRTKGTLMARQKALKREGRLRPSRKSEPLLDSEIDHLFSSGTLSLHSPTGLFNMIFFNNGMHFGLSSKEHYELQWGDIKLFIDSGGAEYLEYGKPPLKRKLCDCGIPLSGKEHRPRIYSSKSDPEMDPILAYKKYWEKRQYMKNAPDSPFYLSPVGDSAGLFCTGWFTDRKVGVNKIKDIMARIKIQAGLSDSKRFTNHSIRLTCTYKLGRSACTRCADRITADYEPKFKHVGIKPCDVVSTTYGESDCEDIDIKKEDEDSRTGEAITIECHPQMEDTNDGTDVSEPEDSPNEDECSIRAPVVVNVMPSVDETITSTCSNTLSKIFPRGCVFHGPVTIHIYNHPPPPPPSS